MPAPDFNAWMKMLNVNGDQTNPAVMSQMAQQASPSGIGSNSMPPPMPGPTPQIVPPPQPRTLQTVQPTTDPLGTLPQELIPQQPTMTASAPGLNPVDIYNRIESLKPVDNSKLMQQLQNGEKSYGESQQLHQAEIDKLKEGLANYAQKDQGINFTPLAALSDAMYGGNLTAAAKQMAPQSAAEKAQTMQDMQAKIASLQGEIPKEELESLKNKLSQMGYMDQRQNQLEMAKIMAESKLGQSGTQNARLGIMQDRLALQTGKEARSTVNNDPILKQYVPRIEGAAKIGELIQSAQSGKVVSNQALLGQVNAEVSRLETGSQSPGLGASEKTELQDAAARMGAFRDSITGNPQDAVRPEVLQTANKLVSELSGSYMKGIDSRMGTLKAGMKPEQQDIVDAKHKSIVDTYSPRFGGWHGLNETPAAATSAPKAGDVIDGHTFLGGDPSKPESWKAN